MALIERLMHEASEPDDTHIAVHAFFAAASEVVAGRLTSVQVQSFLNMSAADIADWDALVARIPGSAAGKSLYLHELHGVFILAEGRYPGYDTPAAVRTKLSI